MNQYEQLWRDIRDSPLATSYAREVHRLAKQVAIGVAAIFRDGPGGAAEGTRFLRVDSVFHSRIVETLSTAARLRALLRERKGGNSRTKREILERRVEFLTQQILQGIDLGPILDGAVRNSIEHFDEYIDSVAIQSCQGKIPRPTMFWCDVVLSDREAAVIFAPKGAPDANFFPVRAYIVSERTYCNCGREVNLEPLKHCCEEIVRRIEADGIATDADAARIMLVV